MQKQKLFRRKFRLRVQVLKTISPLTKIRLRTSTLLKLHIVEVSCTELSLIHQNNIIPRKYLSDDHLPKNMCLDELLEVLKESKFQYLESECELTSRLSMAEKDTRSAIELLKYAGSTLRILNLGSREEQSNYLSSWCKIAFICSQVLKHGAYIWNQSVQHNVHNQILSNPEGFRYIYALGEI